MENQQTVKFYGGVAKRVWVLTQDSCDLKPSFSKLEFIRNKFNSVRNYREFNENYPVEINQVRSDKLPRITSLKEDDVCLIIGCGRFVDKASYHFAEKCFENNIPVFFIRANSLDYDSRVKNSTLWQCNILTVKIGKSKQYYQPPSQYFMQIPNKEDFIISKLSEKLYALLPAMVPLL